MMADNDKDCHLNVLLGLDIVGEELKDLDAKTLATSTN